MEDWAPPEDCQAGSVGQHTCKKGSWEQDRYVACPHLSLTAHTRVFAQMFSSAWYINCHQLTDHARVPAPFSRPLIIFAHTDHTHMNFSPLQSACLSSVLSTHSLIDLSPCMQYWYLKFCFPYIQYKQEKTLCMTHFPLMIVVLHHNDWPLIVLLFVPPPQKCWYYLRLTLAVFMVEETLSCSEDHVEMATDKKISFASISGWLVNWYPTIFMITIVTDILMPVELLAPWTHQLIKVKTILQSIGHALVLSILSFEILSHHITSLPSPILRVICQHCMQSQCPAQCITIHPVQEAQASPCWSDSSHLMLTDPFILPHQSQRNHFRAQVPILHLVSHFMIIDKFWSAHC